MGVILLRARLEGRKEVYILPQVTSLLVIAKIVIIVRADGAFAS